MFQTVPASFNSYMCGKCFRQDVNGSGLCGGFNSYMCRECFSGAQVSNLYEWLFQFIYARGMFPGGIYIVLHHIEVSIHICVGDVSPAGDAPVAVGVVSIHICAGNVFAIRLDVFEFASVSIHICAGNVSPLVLWWFQLIYVRGMFPSASGIGRWSTRWFQLIYVRGECFNTGRGHQPMGISFNSYMCGECFQTGTCL